MGWSAEESGHGDAMLTKSCKFLEGEVTGGDAGRVTWGEVGCWGLREGGLEGLGCRELDTAGLGTIKREWVVVIQGLLHWNLRIAQLVDNIICSDY